MNNSNDHLRRVSASIFCEDPFSSSTPYAEELEYNIDFLIDPQDIRQCHFPSDQNRVLSSDHPVPLKVHFAVYLYKTGRNFNPLFSKYS